MWKIFQVIAAFVLAGSAYFAYDNLNVFKERLAEVESNKQRLEGLTQNLQKTNEEITALELSIQMLETETETIQNQKTELDLKVTEAEAMKRAQESALQMAQTDLDKAKGLITNIAEIEAIQREMVQIRTQIEESEIELTQLEGAVASAQVERDRLEKVAAELSALRTDQEAGVIRGEFQSQIRNAYNQWGFVVVTGGNDQGVVNRAQLDVYRRGQPICRLLVTSVEASQSVAEIVPGSLAPGQRVQIGDTVVKSVRVQTPAVVPASAPGAGGVAPAPADGAAPAADPAMAPDPFGGGMQPAAPDPFGGAPAPAAMPPDPFGAPPAANGGAMDGGAGAGATNAPPDPFGAPPAPAPAPNGGTPPDPFQ